MTAAPVSRTLTPEQERTLVARGQSGSLAWGVWGDGTVWVRDANHREKSARSLYLALVALNGEPPL